MEQQTDQTSRWPSPRNPIHSRSTDRLWTKNFIAGTLVNFLLMVNYYVLMVVITDYSMKTYEVSASTAGLSASIFIIGALIARMISGGIIERVGRKRLLVIGAVFEVVFSVLYLHGGELEVLFLVRIFHGFAYGTCSTAIGTIVTSIVPADRKGEGVGYYMLSVTLGAAIGPFLGMLLTQNSGFHTIFYVSVGAAILCLMAAIILKVPSTAEKKTARHAGTVARGTDGDTVGARHSGLHRFIETPVIPISAVCAIVFFCYSSLLTFLTPYAQEIGLATVASFFFIVYAIAMFVTRPVTGKLFDRKGDRFAMVPAFVAFMIGMVLLSLAHEPLALLGSAVLLGFGVGTIQASGLAIAVRATPDSRLGLANSTFYILLDIGVGIGPLFLGFIEPAWGYRGLYLAMAIVAALALVLYLIISRRSGSMVP